MKIRSTYALAKEIYPDIPCDKVFPEEVVFRIVMEVNFDPCSSMIWGYPPFAQDCGCPLPLTCEAADRYASILGIDENDSAMHQPWIELVASRMERE